MVAIILVGCGSGSTPTPVVPDRLSPRPTPIPTATPTLTPTPEHTMTPGPTPTPTPEPLPVLKVLPKPSLETPAPTVKVPALEPTIPPTSTSAPTSTPKPTLLPTPTVQRYAPIGPGSAGSSLPEVYRRSGITYTKAPQIKNDYLTITAVFENMPFEPTDIQIWQFPEGWRRNCPTDKPIAFISPKRSGTERYDWSVCIFPNTKYAKSVLNVPWVEIDTWKYSKRPKGTSVLEESKPTFWDWQVQVDLRYYEVYRLEVDKPTGYLIIIHSGDTLLAREWVDYIY